MLVFVVKQECIATGQQTRNGKSLYNCSIAPKGMVWMRIFFVETKMYNTAICVKSKLNGANSCDNDLLFVCPEVLVHGTILALSVLVGCNVQWSKSFTRKAPETSLELEQIFTDQEISCWHWKWVGRSSKGRLCLGNINDHCWEMCGPEELSYINLSGGWWFCKNKKCHNIFWPSDTLWAFRQMCRKLHEGAAHHIVWILVWYFDYFEGTDIPTIGGCWQLTIIVWCSFCRCGCLLFWCCVPVCLACRPAVPQNPFNWCRKFTWRTSCCTER